MNFNDEDENLVMEDCGGFGGGKRWLEVVRDED